MANSSNFVSDFRAAVVNMLDGFKNAQGLVVFASNMGWNEDTFIPDLNNADDLTPEQFWLAVQTLGGLQATLATEIPILAKLRT